MAFNLTPNAPYFHIEKGRVFRGQREVFADFDLTLNLDEHTAILGPNGSGKSTLIQLIMRDLYPVVQNQSRCEHFGQENIQKWTLRSLIGVVSQDLLENYRALSSGLEVVLSGFYGAVGIHQHHRITVEQRQQALATLDQFRLGDLAERPFLELSTGQQRRLLLARAVVYKPRVLILDEPSNSLDVASAFALQKDIQLLADRGTTLLLVSHHIDEIIPEITRVALLKNGRSYFDGPKSMALTSDRLSHLFETALNVTSQGEFYRWAPA